jgi:hypothetical protein
MSSTSATLAARQPSASAIEIDDPWSLRAGEFRALLGELSPDWNWVRTIAERRSNARCPCDCMARLTSLDEPSLAGDEERQPIAVRLMDISRRGVGLSHADPLPFRLVQITIESSQGPGPGPILVVRLQWCRFRQRGVYESGGQIQRVIAERPSS